MSLLKNLKKDFDREFYLHLSKSFAENSLYGGMGLAFAGAGGQWINAYWNAKRLSGISNKRIDYFNQSMTAKNNDNGLKAQKLERVIRNIEDFLGGEGKIITNREEDMILMRNGRKIRFDANNPHGDKPHFHLEQQTPTGRWIDASFEHRYYFRE